MLKEKITQNTSLQDVAPALANVLSRYDKEDFTAAPVTIQQMFNDLMCTHYGDDSAFREKCVMALTVIADLGNAIEPFSQYALHHFNDPA